jgi:hypothetical protein
MFYAAQLWENLYGASWICEGDYNVLGNLGKYTHFFSYFVLL